MQIAMKDILMQLIPLGKTRVGQRWFSIFTFPHKMSLSALYILEQSLENIPTH